MRRAAPIVLILCVTVSSGAACRDKRDQTPRSGPSAADDTRSQAPEPPAAARAKASAACRTVGSASKPWAAPVGPGRDTRPLPRQLAERAAPHLGRNVLDRVVFDADCDGVLDALIITGTIEDPALHYVDAQGAIDLSPVVAEYAGGKAALLAYATPAYLAGDFPLIAVSTSGRATVYGRIQNRAFAPFDSYAEPRVGDDETCDSAGSHMLLNRDGTFRGIALKQCDAASYLAFDVASQRLRPVAAEPVDTTDAPALHTSPIHWAACAIDPMETAASKGIGYGCEPYRFDDIDVVRPYPHSSLVTQYERVARGNRLTPERMALDRARLTGLRDVQGATTLISRSGARVVSVEYIITTRHADHTADRPAAGMRILTCERTFGDREIFDPAPGNPTEVKCVDELRRLARFR